MLANLLNKIKRNLAIKNAIWIYTSQAINTIIPLLTLPYITKVLGANGYGSLSVALNFIGYLQVVVEYGFGLSATRKVASSSDTTKTIQRLFNPIFISRVFLLIASLAILFIYILLSPISREGCVCLLVVFCGLVGTCFQMNWAFQGTQKMEYIAILSIVSRIASTIFIFLFVKQQSDLYVYCVLYILPQIICGLGGILISRKKFFISFSIPRASELVKEFKSGWLVFTSSFSAKVFGAMGVTFMSFFSTETEIGIFSAIQKIPNIMLLAWLPISQVIYPISSNKWAQSKEEGRLFLKKIKAYILPVFIFMSILIAMFAKQIVNIVFGAEYITYYYWIYPLIIWLIASILNNFSGIQTLLASGKEKEYSKAFYISLGITVIINCVFVYLWGGLGAALSPMLSEIVLYFLLRRAIKSNDDL